MADKYTVTALDSGVYTNTANWAGGVAPVAADNIFMQFDSTTAMSGSNQSATELGNITILPSCAGEIGSADTYLQLDQATTKSVVFGGAATAYLDLGTSGSAMRVDKTKSATGGKAGLYLKNNTTPLVLLDLRGGVTRLVSATVTRLIVSAGATVIVDSASTVATIDNNGGTVIDYGAAITTINSTDGTITKTGSDDYALNIYGGTVYNDGTGTATVTQYGGRFDSARDSRDKNVTLTRNGGVAIIGANVALTPTINVTTTLG